MTHLFRRFVAATALLALGTITSVADEKASGPPKAGEGRAGQAAKQAAPTFVLPGNYYMLFMEEVQEQLGLSPEQKQKLKEIAQKYSEVMGLGKKTEWEKARHMKPDEQKKFYAEMRDRYNKGTEKAKKQVEQVLQPKQIEKLKGMEIRGKASRALDYPQLLEQVGLSTEQKEKIRAIREDTNNKIAELHKVSQEKILGILTRDQQDKLKALQTKGFAGGKQPKLFQPLKQPIPDYFWLPGYPSLDRKDVRAKIGLSEEQIRKLKDIRQQYFEFMKTRPQPRADWWTKLSEEERKKKMEEMNAGSKKWGEEIRKRTEEVRRQVEAILTPEQRAGLQGMEFQTQAGPYLLYGTLTDKLGLSEEQKAKLHQTRQDMQNRTAELQKQISQVQEKSYRAALELLTPEQRETLKKLQQEGGLWQKRIISAPPKK
jgi:Spy/CpxP family protein refolding chaperone